MCNKHPMFDAHRASQLHWRSGEIHRLQQVNKCANFGGIKPVVILRARVNLFVYIYLTLRLHVIFIYISSYLRVSRSAGSFSWRYYWQRTDSTSENLTLTSHARRSKKKREQQQNKRAIRTILGGSRSVCVPPPCLLA